jgi:hypothetical protein
VSSEETIFLGDDTAAAAMLRNQRVSAGLSSGPIKWMATVLAGILGKRVEHTPPAMRESSAFGRAVLTGLGYDPDECELGRRRGQNAGMVVRGAAGRPIEFISEKRLRRLAENPVFLAAFDDQTTVA